MPEFQTFMTPERLEQFWHFLKWFMFFAAPILMITVALSTVEQLIHVIKKAIGANSKNDDDDDIDIYRY